MSGTSMLGKALIIVFVVSLVALLAEILYVLWRRRVFRRQGPPEIGGNNQPSDISTASSKELLYFFCLKTQARVEPTRPQVSGPDGLSENDSMEVIDVIKLQEEMYGPSRALFTIKEEEREEMESEKSISSSFSTAEKATNKTKTMNSSECFEVTGGSAEVVVVVVTTNEDIEETPFSTPCASPSYFTPSASPMHEIASSVCIKETAAL